jgi:hypothetical protein
MAKIKGPKKTNRYLDEKNRVRVLFLTYTMLLGMGRGTLFLKRLGKR